MISYTDCKSGTTKTSFKQTAMPEQQEKTGLKRAAAFGKRAYFWGILLAVTLAVLALAPFVCLLCLALPCKMKISLRNYIWLYGRSLTALWRPVMPVTINYADGAEDRFRALSGKGCILAFNHQSFLDSYLVSAQPLRNTCFLIKTWPFRKLFFFILLWSGPSMWIQKKIRTSILRNAVMKRPRTARPLLFSRKGGVPVRVNCNASIPVFSA